MSEITVARYEAFEKGVAFEQERIIKLLKESDSVCNEWAIALIKGETK